MAKPFSQLEFRFPAWLRPAKPSRKSKRQPSAASGCDPGMTAWCQETAASLGLPELARKVRVSWNPRMRTTAGRAWWPDRSIEMNPKLREIADAQVWRTLKHEFAHLIAYERCGRRRIDPHGAEWRAACAELGIPDETTYHNLPLKGRKITRNHFYSCPSCMAVIGRVRPFRRAVACYSCCRKFSGGLYDNRFRLTKTIG
ncbi:SprT-like domain-containing protein [Akkermansiaceae bacterium]|nr:SprT-like domain-containing protein [Akkermansiaceae bacterium]